MKDRTEQFKAGSGSGGFVIVDAIVLGIALGHIVHLVVYHITQIIPLSFADQLAFEWALALRDIGMRD